MNQARFTTLVEEIAAIGQKFIDNWDDHEHSISFGAGGDLDTLRERLAAGPSRLEVELEEWLEARDHEELIKLEALMYWGRQGESLQDLTLELKDAVRRDEGAESIRRNIGEKTGGIGSYFSNALAMAKKFNLDLDTVV